MLRSALRAPPLRQAHPMSDFELRQRLGYGLLCPGCGDELVETPDGHLRCPHGEFGEPEPIAEEREALSHRSFFG